MIVTAGIDIVQEGIPWFPQFVYVHWRQMGRKSGGAEWEFETYLVKFETYLVKFETYSVLRDYETKKTTGAPAPAAPASLAPMSMYYCCCVYCNCMFILAQHKKKSQTFCQILFQIIVKTVQGDEIVW